MALGFQFLLGIKRDGKSATVTLKNKPKKASNYKFMTFLEPKN